MIIFYILMISLICIWGEAVLFSSDVSKLSHALVLFARLTHILNIGILLTMVFVGLIVGSHMISYDYTTILRSSVLFMFIGVVSFAFNATFYVESKHHDAK